MKGALPSSRVALSRIQRVGLGLFIGTAFFAILSFAAAAVQKVVSAKLCALPAGEHFPSGYCILFTSIAGVLWMGLAAILALLSRLQSVIPTMFGIRVISDIMVALFSAFLFAKYGIRKGAMIFILSSIALIGLFTIFFSLFVIM